MWRDREWERGREVEKRCNHWERCRKHTHIQHLNRSFERWKRCKWGKQFIIGTVDPSQHQCICGTIETLVLANNMYSWTNRKYIYTPWSFLFFLLLFIQHINETKNEKKVWMQSKNQEKTRQRTQCEEQKKVEKSERSSDHNRFLNAVANQRQFRLFVRWDCWVSQLL